MRVANGLLLLLLGLCGSWAQGVHETSRFQRAAGEYFEQSINETTPDIGAEVKTLRDMVVELEAELGTMADTVKESATQVESLKAELTTTKVSMEQLQKENSGTDCLFFL